jgi:hypothetical protein
VFPANWRAGRFATRERQETMAGDSKSDVPEFSEAEMAKARAWFAKAADCRERREYDYAIECFITGLGFWPEAVEEGHMPLRSLAVQRHQAGGGKPKMFETLKKPLIAKNARQCMLNAEYLLAKDPGNGGYLDSLLKNSFKAGMLETVRWVTPLVLDSLRKDKKLNKNRFKSFRDAVIAAADQADARGQAPIAVWLLEHAVNSLDFQLARQADEGLRNEQRDLAGRLAIVKGKYQDAESFRESLRDADQQKILHDSERVKQAEESYEALVAAARKDLAENPDVPQKIYALVDILTRRESKESEGEAIALLLKAYEKSRNYSFKMQADTIRLRQLSRQTRELHEQARRSGSEEDQQQLRLARMEQSQTELEIYRERVLKYPTDLGLKYRLGRALFLAHEYDEAIPALQAAQGDPRNRYKSRLLMSRAFFEKGNFVQAVDVLKEICDIPDLPEELTKEVIYWLARSLESASHVDEARAAYSKLLRQDYNYADGEARRRLEALTATT